MTNRRSGLGSVRWLGQRVAPQVRPHHLPFLCAGCERLRSARPRGRERAGGSTPTTLEYGRRLGQLSSHGIAAPPPLHEACRRQSKGRRTCESLIAQRAGQGKQKVGKTRAEGAWDSDVSPRPPPRDRSRWLRVGATPPTDSCLEQPEIMPFLPPVIVDGHAYCREPSRPAYTPHEFRILVGFSREIRNQFFEHMNAGKLPKNQEGFPAVQTVRQNDDLSNH